MPKVTMILICISTALSARARLLINVIIIDKNFVLIAHFRGYNVGAVLR